MDYDLIVIGGGNAIGLVRDAGAAGQRVALIEEDLLGGTCPNRGCVPSKLLLGYADAAHAVRDAGRFHVEARLGAIDGDALLAETFGATRRTDGRAERGLPEHVTLFRGRGRFVGPHEVEVDGQRLKAPRIVIGTGARPRRPDLEGIGALPYWTSREVFRMDTLPASIVIVGGGFIGVEMATFFHGVGVPTTLIHRDAELMGAADRELRARFTEAFTGRVPTHLRTEVEAVRHDGTGFAIDLRDAGGSQTTLEAERVLFAIGRVPNADDLGLEHAGIVRNERGAIQVDGHLRTNVEGVYALGDVNGNFAFTHAASYEAQYLSRVFLEGETAPIDYGAMPSASFSRPEYASIGATEQDLERDQVPYVAASVPYTSAAKGRAIKEADGACKFLLAPSGEILGCHILGEHASVLIHEVIPVMRWRNHISSLTEIIHIHPALSEVVRNAARKARDRLAPEARRLA